MPGAVFAASLGHRSLQFAVPSPSLSVSATPQPQIPAASLSGSCGQPSLQSGVPSRSESVVDQLSTKEAPVIAPSRPATRIQQPSPAASGTSKREPGPQGAGASSLQSPERSGAALRVGHAEYAVSTVSAAPQVETVNVVAQGASKRYQTSKAVNSPPHGARESAPRLDGSAVAPSSEPDNDPPATDSERASEQSSFGSLKARKHSRSNAPLALVSECTSTE